ncbi:hypothetical protein [Neisseria gonorrhoeae]|nr:hypothetical protein [Neisseria gonorrhoeae]
MSFKLRYLASVLALSSLLAACGGQEKSAAGKPVLPIISSVYLSHL